MVIQLFDRILMQMIYQQFYQDYRHHHLAMIYPCPHLLWKHQHQLLQRLKVWHYSLISIRFIPSSLSSSLFLFTMYFFFFLFNVWFYHIQLFTNASSIHYLLYLLFIFLFLFPYLLYKYVTWFRIIDKSKWMENNYHYYQ